MCAETWKLPKFWQSGKVAWRFFTSWLLFLLKVWGSCDKQEELFFSIESIFLANT